MRQNHVAGERLFVDYAGTTLDVIDGTTGEVRTAQLFVAALGASSYAYADAYAVKGFDHRDQPLSVKRIDVTPKGKAAKYGLESRPQRRLGLRRRHPPGRRGHRRRLAPVVEAERPLARHRSGCCIGPGVGHRGGVEGLCRRPRLLGATPVGATAWVGCWRSRSGTG
jgi:hypothetical protein